jgi:hypothetical protein
MAISLYDTEEVTPVQTIEEVKKEKEKQKIEPVSKVKKAKAPPTMGEAFQTFLGDIGVKPGVEAMSKAPDTVKDYLMNPIQYNPGGEKDYTNIDMSATLPRLAADAAALYTGAKGVQYGVGQMFPGAGVKQQKDELAFRKQELERQMKGELTPQEKASIALQNAKTQQIMQSLNPTPSATPPIAPTAPPVAPPTQTAPPMQTNVSAPPTVQQRTVTGDVTDAEKLAAENIKMQPTELPGHTFNKYGVAPTNVKDLMIFANQATPEMKANFAPYLFELMNKGVIPKPALDAGVTPSTSQPEAQTLVTTSEAAKDPVEKAQEKTIEGAAKPKATKAKNPVESMKNYLTGSQGFNEEQYNTLMKDILGKDLEMPSTGGGFGEKSHPEEWNKYMAWRKENIEGPKANLGFDIKKKFRDVEKIEDPKIRATARNALLVSLASLPAFLNAKTSKEMREARQGLGEAVLPIGMTPIEAGAPTLPPNAYSESRKLGSPFRQQLMGVAPPAR